MSCPQDTCTCASLRRTTPNTLRRRIGVGASRRLRPLRPDPEPDRVRRVSAFELHPHGTSDMWLGS